MSTAQTACLLEHLLRHQAMLRAMQTWPEHVEHNAAVDAVRKERCNVELVEALIISDDPDFETSSATTNSVSSSCAAKPAIPAKHVSRSA
jgi:hypothetical protein